MNIDEYWTAVLQQKPEEIRKFFHANAFVNWHNTNEHFTVDEFIRANCEYPGQWDGIIERVEEKGGLIIAVVHVFSRSRDISCHVTSFIEVVGEKISAIDEYWGDDGSVPQWRMNLRMGTPIKT